MNEQQFIKKWIEKIETDPLTKFPNEYINEIETENFNLPGKSFSITSELFGQYELMDIDENIIIQTENLYLVKFLLYANRSKPNSVSIPIATDALKTIVKKYENRLDLIIKDVLENIKVVLPNSEPLKLSNQIFNLINLKRY